MKKETIIGKASTIVNGDKVTIKYLKPAGVMTKRTFERKQLEASLLENHKKDSEPYKQALKEGKKSLIKVADGGNDPVIKLYKITTYEFIYDERDYFSQCLEEQYQNLNPIQKESPYNKINGALYAKKDESGKQYFRCAIREDRVSNTVSYSSDKAGKSEKNYNDIEKYLKESDRHGYKSYNRQMGITATGKKPEVEIRQINLDIDRILLMDIEKVNI